MLEELKKQVCDANLELVRRGVVIYTWGNVSGIDREKGLMVIKPSGVDYDGMKPEDMVVVDLVSGERVNGNHHQILKHIWNSIGHSLKSEELRTLIQSMRLHSRRQAGTSQL